MPRQHLEAESPQNKKKRYRKTQSQGVDERSGKVAE